MLAKVYCSLRVAWRSSNGHQFAVRFYRVYENCYGGAGDESYWEKDRELPRLLLSFTASTKYCSVELDVYASKGGPPPP